MREIEIECKFNEAWWVYPFLHILCFISKYIVDVPFDVFAFIVKRGIKVEKVKLC
jgi:hypothetical protein